ncbi:hypothetical protein ICV35_23800 [Rhodococcus ruber]|uniref:hypothetical protein n=1 Tax=Rhodococcus ruber TaxID=1830 RepID=UPI001784CA98|nr:hypothetical protein [Rhodococcus ruber]MBD8056677.1 hypothetical protein [Rhodococcus ruber]
MTKAHLTRSVTYRKPFAVYRPNRPSANFTQISNELIRDNELSTTEFRLLCYLLSHQDGYPLNWVSIEKNIIHTCKNTRRDVVKALVAKGYLAWEEDGKLLAVSDVPMGDESERVLSPSGDGLGLGVPEVSTTDADPGMGSPDDTIGAGMGSLDDTLKNTRTTYKTKKNSEVPSASSEALKDHSGKPGPGIHPNASTIMSSDVDGAKTWIEERIGRGLDSTEDRYAQRRLENWESTGRTWPAIINQVWRAIEKSEREDVPPTILRSIATASAGGGV